MKQRWKKGMAWLLSALCILVTVQIPSISAKAATKINFEEKIASQRAKFPDGKYWNHWINSYNDPDATNNPDGYTDQPCTNHSGTGNPDCNKFDGGLQCLGYAMKTYYDVYGQHYDNGPKYYLAGDIQVGDMVTVNTEGSYLGEDGKWYPNQHTIFVIGRNGETLTVTECNALNDPCRIYWDTTYTIMGNKTLKDNKYSNVTYEFAIGRHKPSDVTFEKTNQRPFGAVDTAEATGVNKIHVAGWAHDPDSSNDTPMEIHVYLGTADNQVETYVGKITTSFKRENDYQGFDATFNTPVSGNKYIYVWAIDTSGEDNNAMIGSKLVNIPSDTEKPTISNLKLVSKNSDGYTLQCNVSDNVGVSYVYFSTCTEASGKTDWVAYKVDNIVNGVATCKIKTSDFANREGIYYTDIAAYDAAGNESTPINTQYNIDRTAPVVISAEITSRDKDGYNVTATATDNVGVTVIKFPSWKSGGTEDDIVWYEGTPVVNGTSTCRINIKDLKSENGKYWTDIRAYDADGNVSGLTSINHLSVSIDSDAPAISDVTTTKLSDSSYKVSCKVTDDNLKSVQFGTSVNGKQEVWNTVSAKDGVYEAVISADDFSSEAGSYVTTIKAVDTFGNESTKKSETVNLTGSEKPLTGITLNKDSLELEKGAAETLTVSYSPADTTDSKDVTWTSNDKSIATVSDGTVTAVGKGTATITAKVGNYEASCSVTVTEKEVTPSSEPTETPTPSEDPSPTPSVDPDPTPSVDPDPTPSEDPSPTPSVDPDPTPSVSPDPTPSVDPDPTPSEDPDPTPSVSPDPAPTEKPNPTIKPDVPVKNPVSQHAHNFSWVTVQTASKTQDGLEELKCDCGMVKESSVIPASQVYVNELYQNLGKAPKDGEVSFDSGRIYTISDYLIKKLQERADVTTTITFEYQYKKYRMIIPAGVDYTEFLEDDVYFYGYFYFAKEVGAKIEEL